MRERRHLPKVIRTDRYLIDSSLCISHRARTQIVATPHHRHAIQYVFLCSVFRLHGYLFSGEKRPQLAEIDLHVFVEDFGIVDEYQQLSSEMTVEVAVDQIRKCSFRSKTQVAKQIRERFQNARFPCSGFGTVKKRQTFVAFTRVLNLICHPTDKMKRIVQSVVSIRRVDTGSFPPPASRCDHVNEHFHRFGKIFVVPDDLGRLVQSPPQSGICVQQACWG